MQRAYGILWLVLTTTVWQGNIPLAQTLDSVQIGGVWRRFIVYVPSAYYTMGGTVPLIVNLHGYGSSALEQMLYSRMNEVADTAGFIVVYPEGTEDPFGNRYWNAGFSPYGANDTLFLNTLIDTLLERYRINPNHVFICGMSNGGIMSYYIACFASWRIAAIGVVAGTMIRGWADICRPPKRVSVVHFHGTADSIVPYGGSVTMLPVDSAIYHWEELHQCTPPADSSRVDSLTDGTAVDIFRWHHCLQNATSHVVLFRVENGGHTWPGAVYVPGLGAVTMEINASEELWRFFCETVACKSSPPTTIYTPKTKTPLKVSDRPPLTIDLLGRTTTPCPHCQQKTTMNRRVSIIFPLYELPAGRQPPPDTHPQ